MTTDFMHLFDLPEVELIEDVPNRYVISTNYYVDLCVNMDMNKMINIPNVRLYAGKKCGRYFSLESHEVEIKLYSYGFNNHLFAILKPQNLVHFDLNKLSKEIPTVHYFSWNDYKNKKGVIDEVGKLKFLNDLLKQKTNATSKR